MGAYNGTGTFVRSYDWTTDEGNGINIEASRMDTEDDGFATGLSNCITKDGQTIITANIPFNSKKITGLNNGSDRTDSIALGQVQDGTYTTLGTLGGSADTYTASPSPAITAYAIGMEFNLKVNADNTGATTLNISAVAAKDVKKYDGAGAVVDLEAGDLQQDQYYKVIYDGAQFVVLNPQSPYINLTNTGATTTTKGSNYIANQITISNGTDADHDIDFTAGNFQFNDGSGQATMTAKTGELDALFGTGNGMLDTGTIAVDSIYYLFTVYNPTTGDSKPLASLSATAPTMTLADADGYTVLGERVGGIETDGSANIKANYLSVKTATGLVTRFQTGAVATGTTTIPWDNTIPQITEGNEYMSASHTPLSTKSKLRIDVVVNVATNINTGAEMTTALFQNSTANALASVNHYSGVTNTPQNAKLTYHMESGTISPIVFKVRIGATAANVTTFNGAYGARKGGGVLTSSITITEY